MFAYRLSGVTECDGFSRLVYGKCSCHGYLPNDVEIATKDDIDEYISQKKQEFDKTLKYYEELKDKARA